MVSSLENQALRQRVLEALKTQEAEKEPEQISRAEFMLLVQDTLHHLRLMAATHNFTVNQLESLIARANRLAEIDGVKVYYYLDEKNATLSVEAEIKEYGFKGQGLHADEDEDEPLPYVTTADATDEVSDEDEDEEVDDFEEIDRTTFFLVTEQMRNQLMARASELNEQISGLSQLIEEVEDYEMESGIKLTYFYDEDQDLFSYSVQRKKSIGFVPEK